MGQDFVKQIDAKESLDEIWVVARRRERLEALAGQVSAKLRIFALDLTEESSYDVLRQTLEEQKPSVRYLVNASGFGKFGSYEEIPLEDSLGMIDLNCKAMVTVTSLVLPYMMEGGNILQVDSLSAFQPVPYMVIYAASKAFVLSYSRGLNAELGKRGICVTAVCPGWVQTEFFDRAKQVNDQAITYYNVMYQSKDVVRTALKHAERRKSVSIHGFPVKFQVFLVKLMPHRFVMWVWGRQQKLDLKKKRIS